MIIVVCFFINGFVIKQTITRVLVSLPDHDPSFADLSHHSQIFVCLKIFYITQKKEYCAF